MSRKLLAVGNLLKKDDGIAVCLAQNLKERLQMAGIEVVCCETDIGYGISQIKEEDYVILLDASYFGITPGEITVLSFDQIITDRRSLTLHDIGLPDLFRRYFPKLNGTVITVEIAEAGYGYGPGEQLKKQMEDISQKIFDRIIHI